MERLYDDLAAWWPLISPPEDYADDAALFLAALGSGGRPLREVLELGSGGGHVAVHFPHDVALTLTDLSESMLQASAELNPRAEHIVADMRTIDLGRVFDGVLLYDAVDYLCSTGDLVATFSAARRHLREGGVLVVSPDHTREEYHPRTGHGGVDGADGRAARYLEWSFDPDPQDTTIRTDYVFCLRAADGTLTTVADSHTTGLFDRATWLAAFESAGFTAVDCLDASDAAFGPRTLFVAHR